MNSYLRGRTRSNPDFTKKQKMRWEHISELLIPGEYDGVMKIPGHYVAHSIGEKGEADIYDIYDDDMNFLFSIQTVDELAEFMKK